MLIYRCSYHLAFISPTVLDQTVRRETVVEVQPIIHRMVEEPEVHIIEKHIYEKVPSMGPKTVTKQAIVEETVKPQIIEGEHTLIGAVLVL